MTALAGLQATTDDHAAHDNHDDHDDHDEAIARRLAHPGFPALRERMVAVDGCAAPIRLTGRYAIGRPDASGGLGDVLHDKTGTIEVPCGNRRDTVCPACSQRYAADAFHLTRAGLAGQDSAPDRGRASDGVHDPDRALVRVGPHPPPHHLRPDRPLPLRHRPPPGRPAVGTPTAPERYDYVGAVLWQAHASQLWNRFTTVLRRTIAKRAGVPVRELTGHLRVSFAKVAEYQRRGLVHFHAVVRLDSFAGPVLPPPKWATVDLLTDAVHTAAAATLTRDVPGFDGTPRPVTFAWGTQLDVRPITPPTAERPAIRPLSGHHEADQDGDGQDDPSGDQGAALSAQALAGPIAKYATKSTGATDGADHRLRTLAEIALVPASAHHRRLMWTCWALGARPGLERLRRWAHMLGFGGHFLSKSRTYSTTFRELRGARREHARAALLEHLGITDDEDIAVINHWQYVGHGWADPADRDIAIGIHQRHQDQKRQHYRSAREAA